MYPGNSTAKSKARIIHWVSVAAARPKNNLHVGFAGPNPNDGDVPVFLCTKSSKTGYLRLYERHTPSYLLAKKSAIHNNVQIVNEDIRLLGEEVGSAVLDFCGPLCPETTEVIRHVCSKLIRNGIVTMTVQIGREADTWERYLEKQNEIAGTYGSRMLALYQEILPHTGKEWFAPIRAIGYVGHKVPMGQFTFKKERKKSRDERLSRIVNALTGLEMI